MKGKAEREGEGKGEEEKGREEPAGKGARPYAPHVANYWLRHCPAALRYDVGPTAVSLRGKPCRIPLSFFSAIVLYSWLLASWCRLSVRLTVCNAVHCGVQGWRTGLKVAPACS